MKRYESEFISFDDESLFYQIWSQSNHPKGWFIITHGQGEHSDCYQRFVEGTKDCQFNTLAWDLRGHGRSSGNRGYANQFSDYVDDFLFFNKNIVPKITQDKPCVWVAHSLGGLIQLQSFLKTPLGDTKTQILSNPYLSLKMEVPLVKDLGALLLNKYLPKLTLSNEIKNSDLSQDPLVLKEYDSDSLRHHKINARVHIGSKKAQEEVKNNGSYFQGPTLLLLSEDDPIVSTPTNREFYETIGSYHKDLYRYKDQKHELFNDIGREQVFSDINLWINKQLK